MLYTKEINGRQVFSDCINILTSDGFWISNPTPEQIAAEGWVEYIPDESLPTPMTDPDVEEFMEAVRKVADQANIKVDINVPVKKNINSNL